MDNLERMFRHLVRTIRSRFPQYLTQPFEVGELHQTILPYRHHRRELGLETNEDYEITLLELLSGAQNLLVVDDQMRDALSAELTARNPDPGAFRRFADRQISLAPEALRRVAETPIPAPRPDDTIVSAPAIPTPSGRASAAAREPERTEAQPQPAARPGIVPAEGEHCRSCGEGLPVGRSITFCPHCGQNLTTKNCPACGSELEVGWRFCPVCGRPA